MANLLSRDDRALRDMTETDAAIEDRLIEAFVEAERDGQITVTEYLRIRTLAYLSLQQTQAINQGWCNRAAGRPVTPVEVSAEAVLA